MHMSEQSGDNTRYIYLPLASSLIEEEISLLDYWRMIKARKWFVILFTLFFTLLAAGGIYLIPTSYTAEVQMVHAGDQLSSSSDTSDDRSTRDSSSSSASSGSSEEAVAILQSRAFLSEFIKDENLLPVLYSGRWDKKHQQWKQEKGIKPPTMWEATNQFQNKILTVETDKSGITLLSVVWKNADQAADWGNKLVHRINKHLKLRDIKKAERSLQFLREEIARTDIADLEESLYGLVEDQLRIIMVARVSDDYAFTVIDPAVPPEDQTWTPVKRIILGILAGITILLLGAFIALIRGYFARDKQENTPAAG